MTIISILPIILIAAVLLLPIIPIRQKPSWIVFLPLAAVILFLVHFLVDGFQMVLLGAYLFSLIVFLIKLPPLVNYFRRSHPVEERNSPRHPFLAVIGRICLLALLGFSCIPAVILPFNYRSPIPTGRFSIGTVTYGWEDTSRLETYTEDPSDYRKIAVQFWYPAGPEASAKTAVENAPISPEKAAYPIVVFSHGAFGLRSSNTTTYEELASQGYIVASIDHTYHAFYTRFPDGNSAMISQGFLMDIQRNQSGQMTPEEDMRTAAGWLDLRTADILFTLDQIQKLNSALEPTSPLTGHIDESKIGLFGHSLGGAAAAAVCREDTRCRAAVVIDSTMFGEYQRNTTERILVTEPYPKPLLIFYNGDTYHATPDHQGYIPDIHAFEHAAAPAYSVIVNGAQHLNFTDLPARAPVLARLLGNSMTVNGGTAGEIDQARCMEILDAYILNFFNQTLLGETSSLLSSTTPYPEVEYQMHPVP